MTTARSTRARKYRQLDGHSKRAAPIALAGTVVISAGEPSGQRRVQFVDSQRPIVWLTLQDCPRSRWYRSRVDATTVFVRQSRASLVRRLLIPSAWPSPRL